MRRRSLTFHDLRLRRHAAPWQSSAEKRFAARERRFLQGAPLALGGAIMFLPAWLFLVFRPRIPHAPLAALLILPLLGLAAAAGVKKLVSCICEQPFDVLTALSFGVLLIFGVLVVYAAMFLYVAR